MSGSIKTWDHAQEFCKHRGGELVKINSFEENEFVLKLVNQCDPPLKQVWIGLRWKPYAKTFLWSDNSIPFFKYWAPYEPNGKAREPCGHIRGTETRSIVRRVPGMISSVRAYPIFPMVLSARGCTWYALDC